jgi:glycolate oxidase iron-sulfur subunit
MTDILPLDLSNLNQRRFLECVHCGLCLSACPTYLETGDENDSPRGRIHLMRAVAEGRLDHTPAVQRHLDLCLDCRSCETACPSGVHYGELIEGFRFAQEAGRERPPAETLLRDSVLFGLFPYPELVRPALWGARMSQALGIQQFLEVTGLKDLLPYGVRKMMDLLPAPGTWQPERELPEFLPAEGERRARVAFFTGCSASVMFPGTNYNTAAILARNGCDVITPAGQACCGAIHYHNGDQGKARDFARRNLEIFGALDVDAVVTNCGGCGHMLKHAPDLFGADETHARGEARRFAGRITDVSELLMDLGPVEPTVAIEATCTYHDSCHLSHGMGVRGEPRSLLARIRGLKLIPLRESDICCGAAGTYNITEPGMSGRLGERKLQHIRETGASIVAAGNVVCLMQITQSVREARLPVEVVHTVDLLARAYGIG